MADHDDDIDALHAALENLRGPEHWRSILTALVAERNALKQRVAELEAKPADRDLRERLVCAALTGILAHEGREREFDCVMEDAMWMAGKAIALMRKGESDGK